MNKKFRYSKLIHLSLLTGFFVSAIAQAQTVDDGKSRSLQLSPISDYLEVYCKRFIKVEKNALTNMLRDLENTPYAAIDYFQSAECDPRKVGGIKSPLLHLIAEAPCSRVEYPQIVYKFGSFEF